MKYLNNYFGFLDLVLEEYIKLDVPLHYSQKFKDIIYVLKNRGDKVADFLIYILDDINYTYDITFIHTGKTAENLSFIQVNRVLRMIDTEKGDPESEFQGQRTGQLPQDYLNRMGRYARDEKNDVWTNDRQRTELSVGRFVRKILDKSNPRNLTQNDINSFVDSYRAYINFQSQKKQLLEIVSGEDISHLRNT